MILLTPEALAGLTLGHTAVTPTVLTGWWVGDLVDEAHFLFSVDM